MIKEQKKLQRKLGTDIHSQNFINMSGYALITEVVEALNETPWKPWKKRQRFNREKFKAELIDCFHFLLNLCISVDMTDIEIYKMYLEKNKTNHERAENGY